MLVWSPIHLAHRSQDFLVLISSHQHPSYSATAVHECCPSGCRCRKVGGLGSPRCGGGGGGDNLLAASMSATSAQPGAAGILMVSVAFVSVFCRHSVWRAQRCRRESIVLYSVIITVAQHGYQVQQRQFNHQQRNRRSLSEFTPAHLLPFLQYRSNCLISVARSGHNILTLQVDSNWGISRDWIVDRPWELQTVKLVPHLFDRYPVQSVE